MVIVIWLVKKIANTVGPQIGRIQIMQFRNRAIITYYFSDQILAGQNTAVPNMY